LAQGVVADLDVSGVEIHVGERDMAEGAPSDCFDALIKAAADA
tara:strand:+ start:19813 stop:19941 length:129 start_codon:yes stop_codon:yes gene_type:complete